MKKEMILLVGCIILVLGIFIKTGKETEEKEIEDQEIKAVYLSYIELNKYFDNKTEEESKIKIEEILTNLEKDGFNWIFLHTRSFSDSIYPSKIFPVNYSITRDEKKKISFDLLKHFTEKAHEKNIKVHAWINPFRIRNNIDLGSITANNPCFKYLGTEHVKIIEGTGIFYNPASKEVQNLIVEGILEIVKNYKIDGIHLDDYFYPTTKEEIDKEFYEEYKKEGGMLELIDYRIENINNLVSKIYTRIKEANPNILIGIAPEGNIENNYQNHYADILTWLTNKGYVDYIMPQLYYGFQNQAKPFTETLNEWNKYIEEDIFLIPAFGLYKSGSIDDYAKEGKNEWLEHKNIIANQVQISRNMTNYKGFAVFRYDNLYNASNNTMQEEVEHLKEILKN